MMSSKLILALVLPILLANASARAQAATAPPDSLRRGAFLEQLQQEDFEFFADEILAVDAAYGDSLVTRLEELGLEGFQQLEERRSRRFDIDYGPGTRLTTFNRVEGFVAAGALDVHPLGPRGFSVTTEAGYAFSSEEPRHYSQLELPSDGDRQSSALRLHYADRVQPFGSNRIFGNGIRSLLGAADEQDYLRRRGGGGELSWQRGRGSLSLGYEAQRETSVGVSTDIALFGELAQSNPPIDEGIDRAVVAGLSWGQRSLEQLRASLQYRVSGGGLGGEFAYNRADATLEARRYVRRFELSSQLHYVRTGGEPPIQQLADVGGLSTVRGFPRRSRVGASSLAGRFEILVPYDVLGRLRVPLLGRTRLQFVPFADAARVYDGDSDQWIHSAGLGVQRFLGAMGRASYLRLDISVPVGPERPADVHFTVSFAPGLL